MSASDFIRAIIRYISKYGIPASVWSDNSKSFISFSSLLSDLITSNVLQLHFIKYKIDFKTIPSYSPWFGASWKGLLKTMKTCMYEARCRQTIHYFNF